MNIKVSIIIASYNSEKFINRAINSVLNQTFKNWELIIIDDASIDRTQSIIKDWERKNRRIKSIFLEKNSGGLATPFNKGILNTEGEYIAFLDADDEWLPEKLEEQIVFLEDNKLFDGVTCYGNIILDDEKKTKLGILRQSDDYKDQLGILINGFFPSIPSSLLLKKEIFNKIGYYDEFLKLSADSDMMIRIFKEGFKIGVIKKILFNYYIHKQNLTGITAEAKIKNINQRIKETEYILSKHEEVYKKYPKAKSLMLRYLSTFYKLIRDNQKSWYYAQESFKTNKNLRNIFHFFLLLLPYRLFSKLYDFKVNFSIYKEIFKNKLKIY